MSNRTDNLPICVQPLQIRDLPANHVQLVLKPPDLMQNVGRVFGSVLGNQLLTPKNRAIEIHHAKNCMSQAWHTPGSLGESTFQKHELGR